MNKRLLIVFILGFSSGLPFALISSTLQAWFAKSNMPLMATAMLSLIAWPYSLRFIWSPILDRYPLLARFGKRRSWIGLTQLALLIGFNTMAWLSPTFHPNALITIALLMALFSATQDIAIDAHRTEYLPNNEHALGASLAVLGYRIALLIASGAALILAQHTSWATTYRVMGFLMLPGLIATWRSSEPSIPSSEHSSICTALIEPFKELFSRPGITTLLLFIFFYKLGEAFTTTTSGIVMPFLIQELGFSLDIIGWVNKTAGLIAIILGGLTAGVVLMRWSLYRALLVFGLLQAVANLAFVLLAYLGPNIPVFITAVVCDNFTAGMGSTALVALFMRLVDRRFTATEFSILVAFSTLPRLFSGPIGALMQSWFGWLGMYQIAFILAFAFVPLLRKMRSQLC